MWDVANYFVVRWRKKKVAEERTRFPWKPDGWAEIHCTNQKQAQRFYDRFKKDPKQEFDVEMIEK